MGGRGLIIAALVATTIVLRLSVAAAATAHVVGGSTGWTIPPNSSFYSDWASSQKVAPGDTLVFNFPTGIHDVVKVPKSSYDSCTSSSTSQIGSTLSTGPATVTAAAGTHYYICAVTGHCSAGQKLAVTVAAAAAVPAVAPTAAPTAATPTGSSPAPAADKVSAGTPASSPAPTTGGPAPTAADTGIAPAVPAATTGAGGPAAASPAGSGANSAPGLRAAATAVVMMAVATASFLF